MSTTAEARLILKYFGRFTGAVRSSAKATTSTLKAVPQATRQKAPEPKTKAIRNAIGTIYPVYKSYKAIESENEKEDKTQWLTYWMIYGGLVLGEGTADMAFSWFPLYYHIKLAFLLWLQLPQFQGARKIYLNYMKPTVDRYQPKIDHIIDVLQRSLGWIVEANSAQLQALGASLTACSAYGVQFIRWFLDTSSSDKDKKAGASSP